MGGAAFLEINTNRNMPQKLEASLKATEIVDCGVGVGGEAWLTSVDGAQAALHLCSLNLNIAKSGVETADVEPRMVSSVSFGAGSLWHSTLPASVRDVLDDAKQQSFIDGLRAAFTTIWKAIQVTHAFHQRLNTPSLISTEREKVAEIFERARRALILAGEPLGPVAADGTVVETKLSPKQIGEVLDELAFKTKECFAEAVKQSKQKETAVPIGPRINFLKFVTPRLDLFFKRSTCYPMPLHLRM